MKLKKLQGFTLIEILVVISIIGLLASIVLVAVNNTRTKAKSAKVIADFKQIQTQVDIARDATSQTVLQITGNGCSDCPFRNGQSVNSNTAALTALHNSWRLLGFSKTPTDPWNNPYLIDENEREGGPNDCRYDQLFSAGPDGIDNVGAADDITINISHFLCQ